MKNVWQKGRVMLTASFAVLGLLLSGCGGKGTQTTAESKEFVYVAEYQQLEEENGVSQVSVIGDKIYYITGAYDEEEDSYTQYLGVLTVGEKKPEHFPLEVEKEAGIAEMSADAEGNLQGIVVTYTSGEEGEEQDFGKWKFCKFSTEGKLLSEMDITDTFADKEDFYVQYVETDKEGNIYIGYEDTVSILDREGKKQFDLQLDNWISAMFSLKDGTVLVDYYGAENEEIHPIDIKNKKIGENLEAMVPMPYGNYVFVRGESSDVLFSGDNKLYAYNMGEEAPTVVLDWIDCDIDSNELLTFMELKDGRILAMVSGWDYDDDTSNTQLVYLTKKKASEVTQKKILTLGTLNLGYDLKKQVIDFNKTNEEYRIEVKCYLTDYSEDAYSLALQQMNTDMVSGNGPDIMELSGGNIRKYAVKGILEDLYPYMEKDAEINKEDYLENILKAYEIDGKLYTLPPTFYINTAMAKVSDVGDKKSITTDELMEIMKGLPKETEIYEYATKDMILSRNIMMNMDNYVDWETGECRFNTEEFIKVLEFSNQFEKDFEYSEDELSTPEKIQEGKLLMVDGIITSVQEYQMYEAMFQEPIAFIGYPTLKENGSTITNADACMAINAKSPNKEGAWQFIRGDLTKEAQENMTDRRHYGFPVMKSALEKQFKEDMTDDYYEDVDGTKKKAPKTTWGFGDYFEVEIYAATEEEVEKVRELIGSLSGVYEYDEEMNKIVMEEAKPFFEGQKSAKDVADIIQNRIQIYVNENR